MPRFYIHSHDGDSLCRDDAGYELKNAAAARYAAVEALPDMARDKLPNGRDRRIFKVQVEDGDRRLIYEATLELVEKWI
jgi:hypothetical protein